MKFLVDMDGVIAHFSHAFLRDWRAAGHPGFDTWDSWDMYNHIPETHHHLIDVFMSRPGFFRTLPVMDGAQLAIASMVEAGHSVVICSTPTYAAHHCTSEKMAWLAEHFGDKIAKASVFTHDKTLVRGDVLIDDKPEIKGMYVPVWKHVLFDAPYNQHVQDRPRMTHWSQWREIAAGPIDRRSAMSTRTTRDLWYRFAYIASDPTRTDDEDREMVELQEKLLTLGVDTRGDVVPRDP